MTMIQSYIRQLLV